MGIDDGVDHRNVPGSAPQTDGGPDLGIKSRIVVVGASHTFYNFGVRFLERCHARAFMPVHSAVHRLTGELADWYGLDAGHLEVGRRADVAVIDPAGFDGSSSAYAEAELPGTGVLRMVNRNDAAVAATLVGGQIVAEYGVLAPLSGSTPRAGRFLRAGTR